ncbi:hypothetical protein HMPREF0972_00787 [Actinomyces sp. oral taxon 848 str. F0332]|nr:hypothetical protein HMPREF0972_00787 [Actinomyces sp. oral taxon 848 str. F0332]
MVSSSGTFHRTRGFNMTFLHMHRTYATNHSAHAMCCSMRSRMC